MHDTLVSNALYADLSLFLLMSDNENASYTDIDMASGAHLRYVFERSDIDFLFSQDVERDHSATISYNTYLALSSGIMKYKPESGNRVSFKHLYAEPIFIFQNNSFRGLTTRFQVGALLYPWSLHLPNFKLNFAIGGVYDWSRWEVNEADKIAKCSPEMQQMINFINSHTPLEDNMYQLSREFRPMLIVNAHLCVTDVLHLHLSTSYQQSLTSPYNQTVIDEYPELGKVYPYIISRLEVRTRIHRYFSLQTTFAIDYENSNLALYDSSWRYKLMFGLAFHLHGREL